MSSLKLKSISCVLMAVLMVSSAYAGNKSQNSKKSFKSDQKCLNCDRAKDKAKDKSKDMPPPSDPAPKDLMQPQAKTVKPQKLQ